MRSKIFIFQELYIHDIISAKAMSSAKMEDANCGIDDIINIRKAGLYEIRI